MYETENNLDEKTRDMSRARQSLIEEMQAIMFYDELYDYLKDDFETVKGENITVYYNEIKNY